MEQSSDRNSRSTSESPTSVEPEVSLPCSQEPASGPYSELDESSLQLPILFF
jgi:hypothetical protein